MDWWWLSFADPDKPKGQQWLGGCYVESDPALAVPDHPKTPGSGKHPMVCAIRRAHQLGINPGGQVRGAGPLPVEELPPMRMRNRLLSKEELEIEKWT